MSELAEEHTFELPGGQFIHVSRASSHGFGQVTTNLWEPTPVEADFTDYTDYQAERASVHAFNGAVNGVQSLVLAQFMAGIDVTTPEYKEALETALTSLSQDYD